MFDVLTVPVILATFKKMDRPAAESCFQKRIVANISESSAPPTWRT